MKTFYVMTCHVTRTGWVYHFNFLKSVTTPLTLNGTRARP